MNGIRGTCTNFGGCKNADDKVVIETYPGGEFICPDCTLSLSPVATKGVSRRVRVLLTGLVAVGVLGVGVIGVLRKIGVDDRGIDSARTDEMQVSPAIADGGHLKKAYEVARGDTALSKQLSQQDPLQRRVENPAPEPVVRTQSRDAATARATSDAEKQDAAIAPRVSVATEPAVNPVRDTAPPAVAPVVAPSAAVVTELPGAPAKLPGSAVLTRRSRLIAQPISRICEQSSKFGDPIEMQLVEPVTLSDGSVVDAGSKLTGRITRRRSVVGNQPALIEIEADMLHVDGRPAAIETNAVSFLLQRPSTIGRVVKGALIGAAVGGAVGFVLGDPLAGAGIGGVVGGSGAAATRSTETCVAPKETRFPFEAAKEVIIR